MPLKDRTEIFLIRHAESQNGLSVESSKLSPGEESAVGIMGALRRTDGLNGRKG